MLAALTRLDPSSTRDVYDRLRAVYNSYHPRGSVAIPPLEEWQGLASICKDLSCRCDVCSKPGRQSAVHE